MNETSVLDELRERLETLLPEDDHVWMHAAFNNFEKAHPGLVDLTDKCAECGAKVHAGSLRRGQDSMWICPVCAEEREV